MSGQAIFGSISAILIKRSVIVGTSEKILFLCAGSVVDTAARHSIAGEIENTYLVVATGCG
jgi:hypothetical protein